MFYKKDYFLFRDCNIYTDWLKVRFYVVFIGKFMLHFNNFFNSFFQSRSQLISKFTT